MPIDSAPAEVPFPAPVDQLATGTFGVCGVIAGEVYCAGYSGEGGAIAASCRPIDLHLAAERVDGVAGAVAIDLGDAFACALSAAGALTCWGCNEAGQIGTGATSTFQAPAVVLTDVERFDLGQTFGCAIQRGGRVSCWGDNTSGQLGAGPGTGPRRPAQVPGLPPIRELRAYRDHACALATSGPLYCWGKGDLYQLGTGRAAREDTPVAVRF
jgi:alpha-tubulin suppressor-like RCC1 family protein